MQSLFWRQVEHSLPCVQNDVGALQSIFTRHATQSPLPVSQTGRSPEQFAFDVQP
jgi:hypothetical protein